MPFAFPYVLDFIGGPMDGCTAMLVPMGINFPPGAMEFELHDEDTDERVFERYTFHNYEGAASIVGFPTDTQRSAKMEYAGTRPASRPVAHKDEGRTLVQKNFDGWWSLSGADICLEHGVSEDAARIVWNVAAVAYEAHSPAKVLREAERRMGRCANELRAALAAFSPGAKALDSDALDRVADVVAMLEEGRL